MVNEFVYCPRLFYYEFVDGIFVPSADTLRGDSDHRRVDQGSGALPKPESSDPSRQITGGEADHQPDGEKNPSETIHSRSVQLGSDRLGVSAKLDLVELQVDGDGQSTAAPVEYKSGRPRQTDDGIEIWDADRVQLGLQMLILRENGYSCDVGILYYRETRQRVRLAWTGELERWIEEQVLGARQCASGPRPPPLENSPKCPRCSLAPICLPDETNWLREVIGSGEPTPAAGPGGPGANDEGTTATGRGDMPAEPGYKPPPRPPGSLARAGHGDDAPIPFPREKLPRSRTRPGSRSDNGELRRLIAAQDDRRAVYLNTPGMTVGLRQGRLIAKEKDKVIQEIRITDVNHLAVFGNIQISTQTIQALCGAGIPITYFSTGGFFYAIARGHSLTNVMTRIAQFRAADDPVTCRALARRMVAGKIRNQRTLLMRNHVDPPEAVLRRLQQAQADVDRADSLDALLGVEGAAAALYFEHFGGMVKPRRTADDEHSAAPELTFDFRTRNRRPPRDPVNALLSLAYSLLAKDFTIAAYTVGFDPYVGFYHQPRCGRAALALDLMEEFRAVVADSAVLTAINNGSVTSRDFVRAGNAVNLTPAGRKVFFEVYEKRLNSTIRHPVFDYQVCYRRAFELQFRLLARALTGELAHYVPFTTR
ncbi:MAG: CRISPR-associated endonuclease Cas1 [Verrucomicrobia bacterium]|nr:CRISPR-associated endonuclease Cas1 [Verrucomicrobiota bacterium]